PAPGGRRTTRIRGRVSGRVYIRVVVRAVARRTSRESVACNEEDNLVGSDRGRRVLCSAGRGVQHEGSLRAESSHREPHSPGGLAAATRGLARAVPQTGKERQRDDGAHRARRIRNGARQQGDSLSLWRRSEHFPRQTSMIRFHSLSRGGAAGWLVGLKTRRARVQIPPPPLLNHTRPVREGWPFVSPSLALRLQRCASLEQIRGMAGELSWLEH